MSTITMLPSQDSGNIYTVLLYRALGTVGFRYVQFPPTIGWVLRHRPQERFHYVHFHWPEVFFNLRPRAWTRLFGLKHYLHVHILWLLLKLRGYRLVWTVHEVDVHDVTQLTWMHAASRRFLWSLCDLVFRRTPLGTFGHPGREALAACAAIAAAELRWDEARREREIGLVEQEYRRLLGGRAG